jgi:hypothetical protein
MDAGPDIHMSFTDKFGFDDGFMDQDRLIASV